MTNLSFEKGWVVQLKSGGPRMTVTHYGEDTFGSTLVWCQWFNTLKPPYKLESGTFEPTALEVIKH